MNEPIDTIYHREVKGVIADLTRALASARRLLAEWHQDGRASPSARQAAGEALRGFDETGPPFNLERLQSTMVKRN